MKEYGRDYFIKSSDSPMSANQNKIEQFMDKIQLAKDISKLKNFKSALVPHYKRLFEAAKSKLSSNNQDFSAKKIYRSI